MSSWVTFHDARALCFGAHREHQFGELGLALGLNPHCDTCFSHQFVGVFRREVGHRRIKLLGTFQIDVAALYVNVGMNAQSHVVAVFQLDGEAHRQEMRGSLAEVFEYRSGHLLGNQRVLVCNLAGESYLVATRCLFVGGYRLPIHAERLYAVVQTNLVFIILSVRLPYTIARLFFIVILSSNQNEVLITYQNKVLVMNQNEVLILEALPNCAKQRIPPRLTEFFEKRLCIVYSTTTFLTVCPPLASMCIM